MLEISGPKEQSTIKNIWDKWTGMNPQLRTAIVGVGSGAIAGVAQWFQNQVPQEPGETMEEYMVRRKATVGKLMRTYMDNYYAHDATYSALDDAGKDAFVAKYNMNQGGRVGYQTGGISMANTLAQNIAANQAQAAQVQQMLQKGRSRLPGATPQAAPAGITSVPTPQAQTMAAPQATLQPIVSAAPQATLQPMAAPQAAPITTAAPSNINYTTGAQIPRSPPQTPRTGGMNPEDFMKLSETDRQKVMDSDFARREADMKKYTNFYTPQGSTPRTVDPMVGKQAYYDITQALKMDYPEAYAKLTGNETLEELDELSGQLAGYWSKGGRVGLYGGGEAGGESLDAGAMDITYEGKRPFKKEEMKMAGPDWYLKRIENLMYNFNMSYEEAGEIAYDSDKYFEVIGHDPYAKGPVLPSDEDPINPWAPKPTGPVLPDKQMAAQGGRIGYAFGPGPVMDPRMAQARMGMGLEGLPGIPRMAPDGMEYDMSVNGGFQPLGAKEGKDDVKANLAKNEFVFTADAVRGAGGGDIELGAQRMYDTMKNLERRVV